MYIESIVVYIDLLGFSDFVNTKSFEEVNDVLLRLKNMMKSYDQHTVASINKDIELNIHEGEFIINDLTFINFSDSIILAYPLDRIDISWTLFVLGLNLMPIQFEMFKNKLPMRGGIATGSMYMNGDMVFGRGLVKSAALEKKAKYPRLMIHEDVIDQVPLHFLEDWIISKDEIGHYFDICKYLKSLENLNKINPEMWQERISSYYNSLKELIEWGLRNPHQEIVNKYRWLEKQFESTQE